MIYSDFHWQGKRPESKDRLNILLSRIWIYEPSYLIKLISISAWPFPRERNNVRIASLAIPGVNVRSANIYGLTLPVKRSFLANVLLSSSRSSSESLISRPLDFRTVGILDCTQCLLFGAAVKNLFLFWKSEYRHPDSNSSVCRKLLTFLDTEWILKIHVEQKTFFRTFVCWNLNLEEI